jgi:hypothetical protein
MHEIGTGSSGKGNCRVPHTVKLVAGMNQEGPSWGSHSLESASEDTRVPLASRGDWYTDDDGLRITIGTGGQSPLVVHGTDDRGGRHCEWEAALLDAGRTTTATTGAQLIRKRSDPLCRSASVPYDYTLHGSGARATLIRHSNAETTTLRLRRHP